MRETRRDFLAALGGTGIATLAGCLDALNGGGEDRPELDVGALREVERLGSPEVPPRTPAPISSAFLDDSESRAREMLDSVPETMSSSTVPNEVVRRIYADAREDAARYLEQADAARSPLERLRSLRSGRGSAAMVKGTYEAAVGSFGEADAHAEAESVRSDVDSFRSEHRYFGGDPGPTLVVHADVEQFVATAQRYLGNTDEPGRYARSAPRVGEILDNVESARASVEAARHLTERYLGALSAPHDFGDVFQRTASSLSTIVSDRRADYPAAYDDVFEGFDRNLDDTPARELLSESFVHMRYGADGARETLQSGRVATSLLAVHRFERNRRAFESATTAVRAGEYGKPTSASAVRETKLAALEALESARSSSVHPGVTRRALTEISHRIRQGDSYLERGLAGDTYRSARNAMGQYAWVQFVAREAPEASAWVLGAVNATLGSTDE